jgi:transcriptional regulator with XRE-family HTH domain
MPEVSISEQLRKAILASGVTRYRIAKENGIDQASLSRFMNGTTGLSGDTIDILCKYLGLKLVKTKRKRSNG